MISSFGLFLKKLTTFLVVALRGRSKDTEWTSKSTPPSKNILKTYSCTPWGALTNFECKLRLKFFSPPWGALQVHPLQPLWLRLWCRLENKYGLMLEEFNGEKLLKHIRHIDSRYLITTVSHSDINLQDTENTHWNKCITLSIYNETYKLTCFNYHSDLNNYIRYTDEKKWICHLGILCCINMKQDLTHIAIRFHI